MSAVSEARNTVAAPFPTEGERMTALPHVTPRVTSLLPAHLRSVKFELVMVTPEMARQWLERNVNNRHLSPGHIDKVRREIQRTGWRLVPDAVAFDVTGALMNAQHRLTLIARGTETVPMLVVWNLPEESWPATDRVKPRSLADTLGRAGEANAKGLAAAIRLLYEYEQTGAMGADQSGPKTVYGEAELLDFFYNQRPTLRESVRTRRIRGLTDATVAVLHFCFGVAYCVEEADAFFGKLDVPAGLEATSPIFVLRQRLDADAAARAGVSIRSSALPSGSRRSYILQPSEKRALAVIAFNKWMKGEAAKNLHWSRGGRQKQAFPLVDGYPHFRDVE